MPIPLRDALTETYAEWQAAFPEAWLPVIRDVSLADADVGAELLLDPWVPIFPTMPGQSDVLGAPRGAHVFRAFFDIRPTDVRAVVVGQDPYPDVAKATGLSFEQGNLRDWSDDAHLVSRSLRRIIQSAAATATGVNAYLEPSGWDKFIEDVRSEQLEPRSPVEFFDESREQGVLWLNTTLSISLFRGEGAYDHQAGHRAFWAPLVDQVLDYLASRSEPCVFILWGSWAKSLREGVEQRAEQAGTAESLGFAEAGHPATKWFLRANALQKVNDELIRLGAAPVDWL